MKQNQTTAIAMAEEEKEKAIKVYHLMTDLCGSELPEAFFKIYNLIVDIMCDPYASGYEIKEYSSELFLLRKLYEMTRSF